MSRLGCPKCKYSSAKVNHSPKMLARFSEDGDIKEEKNTSIRWNFIGWEPRFTCIACNFEFDEPKKWEEADE